VVGVFSNEESVSTLTTEIASRGSEQWALKRYLTMDALEAAKTQTYNIRDIDVFTTASERNRPAFAASDLNIGPNTETSVPGQVLYGHNRIWPRFRPQFTPNSSPIHRAVLIVGVMTDVGAKFCAASACPS
jgi:hypothetical protein